MQKSILHRGVPIWILIIDCNRITADRKKRRNANIFWPCYVMDLVLRQRNPINIKPWLINDQRVIITSPSYIPIHRSNVFEGRRHRRKRSHQGSGGTLLRVVFFFFFFFRPP